MEGMPLKTIKCQIKSVAGSGYVYFTVVKDPFSTYMYGKTSSNSWTCQCIMPKFYLLSPVDHLSLFVR